MIASWFGCGKRPAIMIGKSDGSDAADHFTDLLLVAVSNVGRPA